MNKIVKFLVTEFLFNGHLQSLGSAGIVFISGYLINGYPPSILVLLLIYITFEMVFIFDRFRGFKKDQAGNPERTSHLKSYYHKIPLILGIMFLLWIILIFSIENIYSGLMIILLLIFGLLYPIYFKPLTKYVFMFKNFYVAGVYFILAFYPVLHFQTGASLVILLVATKALLENIFSQAILDTKDIVSDKKDGLKTLAALYGFDTTLNVITLLSVISGVVILLIVMALQLHPILYLLILVDLIINVVVYLWYKKSFKPKMVPLLLSAGKCFIWLCVSVVFALILS